MVDLEGLEPSSHGLKVRSVTFTLQIQMVGRSGVDPDSSGLQPDAFTGLAFFPFRGSLREVPFPKAAPETLAKVPFCSVFLAPPEGLEPSTYRLTAVCSTG